MEFMDRSPRTKVVELFGVAPEVRHEAVVLSNSVFVKTAPVQRKHRRFREKSSSGIHKAQDNTMNTVEKISSSGVFASFPRPGMDQQCEHKPSGKSSISVEVPEEYSDGDDGSTWRHQGGPMRYHEPNLEMESEDLRFLRGIFYNKHLVSKHSKSKLSKATLHRLSSPKFPAASPSNRRPGSATSPGTVSHPRAWKGSMCFFPKPPTVAQAKSKSKPKSNPRTVTAPRTKPADVVGPPVVDKFMDVETPVTATNIIAIEESGEKAGVVSSVGLAPTTPSAPKDKGSLGKKPSPRLQKSNNSTTDVKTISNNNVPDDSVHESESSAPARTSTIPISTTVEGVRCVAVIDPEKNSTVDTADPVDTEWTDRRLECIHKVSEDTVHRALTDALHSIICNPATFTKGQLAKVCL